MQLTFQRLTFAPDIRQWVGCLVLILLCIPAHSQGTRSSIDTLAPVIEIEELAEGVADGSQVFTVLIAEETELKDATLYYRREGQLPFTPAPMQTMGESAFYTVSIATDPDDLRPIEYYIQARDAAGNRTVSGFAFDPYVRTLTAPPATAAGNVSTVTTELPSTEAVAVATPFYQRGWVKIAMGALVVAVVASAISSADEDSEVVDVTLVLE